MLRIPVDGDLELVDVGDFRDMAAKIGAEYVERVRVGEEWSLAVDDSGLILGRAENRRATLLYNYAFTAVYPGSPTQPICGDVLLGREGFVGDGLDWIDTVEADATDFLTSRGVSA